MATSLQTEEAIEIGKRRKPTNESIVTTKEGILFPATMFLSPKPASPTGTSTSACRHRGGTQIRICRKLGEVNPQKDTRITPTLDGGLIQRGIRQRATALSARIATSLLNPLREPREGAPSPGFSLGLTPPLSFLHMFPLGIHLADPVRPAGGGPLPLGLPHPRGPAQLTGAQTLRIYRTVSMMLRWDAAHS